MSIPSPLRAAALELARSPLDERSVVAQVRGGDAVAFEGLFTAYYDGLRAFVLGYVRSEAVAEDLVQDLFVALWAGRAEWQVESTVRGYLYGAARNRALRYLKHQHIADRYRTAALREDAAFARADSGAIARDLSVALARAVERLPVRCRETFTLRRQHELSYAEIAAVMGVTVKCAERQFTKALATLRTELADFF